MLVTVDESEICGHCWVHCVRHSPAVLLLRVPECCRLAAESPPVYAPLTQLTQLTQLTRPVSAADACKITEVFK